MKKRRHILCGNALDCIPTRRAAIRWSVDSAGKVTLLCDCHSPLRRIVQGLLLHPRVRCIHLDETGSLLWQLLDGKRDILALGQLIDARFGEQAHPLYERLTAYLRILDSYHLIGWVEAADPHK